MSGPKQLQNLRVSAHKASSSIAALVVHPVDESGAFVSPGAGSTQVSVKEILTSSGASVMDSTNNAIGVTIRGGSAAGTEYTDGDVDATVSGGAILFDNSSNTLRPVTLTRGLPVNVVAGSAASTTVNVSSLAGAVIVRSSAANALFTAYQSSAADLNVTVAGYSTTANVSSVAGVVRIAGNNAADGIVHVGDSTNNALRVNVVAGAAGGSTTVNISSAAGRVAVAGYHSADGIIDLTDSTNGAMRVNVVTAVLASVAQTSTTWAVQLSQWSTTHNVSSLAGRVAIAGFNATDGIVNVTDSTNTALRVNVVAGAAGGSTEVTVRQSTYADFNGLFRLADRDQSTQVANITNTTPASTAYALAVRQVGFSTTVQVSSLAGKVLVDQNSTVWPVQVSSLAGAVICRSSAADMQVTATQNSTAWSVLARNTTSSGGGLEGSTVTAAGNILGLHVRPVFPTMESTTVVITSTHSTARYSLVSSAAGVRHKVYAYFIGSTHTNPSSAIFQSSGLGGNAGSDKWTVNFGSGSSGITGANLAVTPPAFLFATAVNEPLTIRIEGGSSVTSTTVVRVSFSYFTEA